MIRNKSCKRDYTAPTVRCLLILSILFVFAGCGKSKPDKQTAKLPDTVTMMNYYPLNENSYWEYSWENIRGDQWRASIKVVNTKSDQGFRTVIVTDSTEQYGEYVVNNSAYLWDDEGLKHLYRASIEGDSTSFRPPRKVLPLKLDGGKTYTHDYRYEVFTSSGVIRYAVDVRQTQKIIDSGSVDVGEKHWDNCVAVETVWTETYSNGDKNTRRKLIWYAESVGPVKIISGIPHKAQILKGESTGTLEIHN